MNRWTDWNCDLLSSIRIDLSGSEDDACKALLHLHTACGIDRVCMMPTFDPLHQSTSIFLLKRAAYEDLLKAKLSKELSIIFSAKVLLQPGVSEIIDPEHLVAATGGYLPIVFPAGPYHDWMDVELNRLLYKRKCRLLLMACERFPIFYENETVEKLFRIPNAIYQFQYRALADIKTRRILYNLYRLNKPILFGTGVDCLQKAWDFRPERYQAAALERFSPLEYHRLMRFGTHFCER